MTLPNIDYTNPSFLTVDLANTTNNLITAVNEIMTNTSLQDQINTVANTYATNTYVNTLVANTSADLTAAINLKLDASTYTPLDILTKLLTVDGAASGLDAQFLNGANAAFYLNSTNQNSGTLPNARLSGDYTNIANISVAANVTASIIKATTYFSGNGVNLTSVNAAFFGGLTSSSYALLNSPALTGTPTAPTAAANTNTTQIATTAYVLGQAGVALPSTIGSAAVGTSLKYAREDHNHAAPSFSAITSKPTTIAGYGITDSLVYNNGGSYEINITGSAPWASITGKPSLVLNDGSTYSINISGSAPWSSISGKPTTIAGYGITDSIAYYNSTGLFTKSQAVSVVSLGASGTITPDFSQSNFFSITLTTNATLANPNNLVAGQTGSIHIQQDATGNRTLSYGTSWKFTGGITPTLSTGANKVDRLDYFVANSTFIHASLSKLIGG